jgi:curved DNA-binding protein CbpA
VTDYFVLLGLPRRPAVDEEAVQKNYLRLAAAWHPDAAGGDVEKFRELQEARRTLIDPASRLRHLLEGEGWTGDRTRQAPPPADLFMEVAGALEASKKVLGKRAAASAIARAALAAETAAVQSLLARAAGAVEARRRIHLGRIAVLDEGWTSKDCQEFSEISAELVFLSRWAKELREMEFQIRSLMGG